MKMIANFFFHFGKYIMMLKSTIRKPENMGIYVKELFKQLNVIGVGSFVIVTIISAGYVYWAFTQ